MREARIVRGFILLAVSGVAVFCGNSHGEEAQHAQVLFIVDASGSMGQPLENSTRLEIAKSSLAALLPEVGKKEDLRMGLMLYGHRSKDCDDIEVAVETGAGTAAAINQRVQGLSPVGMTPLAASLKQAGDRLRSLSGHKQIILLSDGEETCGGDPVKVAANLVAEGIDFNIHVIGFAVEGTAVAQLQKIAEAGNGRFKKADTASELAGALDDITGSIETNILGEAQRDKAVVKDVYFQDDFARDELGPDWKIIDEDPDRWVMDNGFLAITRTTEKIRDDSSERWACFNTLELQKPLPEDYEITVEWEIPFQSAYSMGQAVCVSLVNDAGDSVQVGFEHGTFGMAYHYLHRAFKKVLGGKVSEILKGEQEKVPKEMELQKVRARITKKKFTFKAYTQVTGGAWEEIGEHKFLKFKNLKLRIYQYNRKPDYDVYAAPEVEAVVKSVVIREAE
ncbi:MAG: VWA domain-containing protein [Verrucomicrobia bacterium]|nr:VWA domain-containing protein [Verrucomicrobiota bacterium]